MTPESPQKPVNSNGETRPARKPAQQPWWKRLDDYIWRAPDETARGIAVFVQRWLQILDRSLRSFYQHNGLANASSLTHTSLLTLVPLLAILLALLKGFGLHDAAFNAIKQIPIISELRVERSVPILGPAVDEFTTQTLAVKGGTETGGTAPPAQNETSTTLAVGTPTRATQAAASPTTATGETSRRTPVESTEHVKSISALDIIERIFTYVDNTNVGNLKFWGFVGLLLVVISLMSKIESVMNDAWAVHRSRSIGRKLADYMNLLVVLAILLVGLSTTTWIGVALEAFDNVGRRFGLSEAHGLLIKGLVYPIVWAAFIFLYYYMPNTRVRWRSAAAGGLIAGTLFQLLQIGFIRFPFLFRNYNVIYGSFAIVLILLSWVYLSWCIVLWGVEICGTHQNLRNWRRQRRAWMGTPAERETLALRMAALLAAPLLRPREAKRMDAGDLADALMLPPLPVGEMLELFQANGLLIQSADDGTYALARSPEQLSVLDVLRMARQGRLDPSAGNHGFLEQVARGLSEPLANQSVKDLVAMPLDRIQSLIF